MNILLRLSLGLCLTVALGQEVAPNFSGVWELNKTASPASPHMPDRWRVKIDQQGTAFSVTMRVTTGAQQEQQSMRYVVGQESKGEMHGAPMVSQTVWEARDLVIHSVAKFGDRELRMNTRWSISADGTTLTFRQRHQFGSEPEGEDVVVFDRRPADSWEPDAPPKPAEEVYKNIQILKGEPATRVVPIMNMLNRWLGVGCDHCHVGTEYEKEDKPAKQQARKMFTMVRRIADENFAGKSPVTCWTCHRGSTKPESLPPQ
jgi:hypothetical protein